MVGHFLLLIELNGRKHVFYEISSTLVYVSDSAEIDLSVRFVSY